MLKMGCVKVDVTPKSAEMMQGYGARNALSKFVVDPLHAGVMVLEQGKKRQLLLTVDNIGIQSDACKILFADLAKVGFDASNIYLCCSHTHFGPGVLIQTVVNTPNGELPIGRVAPSKEYYKLFLSQIKKGIAQAIKKLEPVVMEEAALQLNELSMNRRPIVRQGKNKGMVETNYTYPRYPADAKYTWQPVDPLFYVWRFKDKKGNLKGIIGRFSCHPVTGGVDDFYGISADYPGYFQTYAEEIFKCPTMFILGNAGDLVPMQRHGESRQDLGHIMAYAIRLAELRFRPSPEFKLGLEKVTLHLKLRKTCRPKEVGRLLDAAIAKAQKAKKCTDELVELAYEERNALAHGGPEDDMQMTLMPFGRKIMVGLPFEVLTSVGRAIVTACPRAIVTSITCGYDGYLPMANEFPQGGYEATEGAFFEERAGNKIVAAVTKAVRAIAKK